MTTSSRLWYAPPWRAEKGTGCLSCPLSTTSRPWLLHDHVPGPGQRDLLGDDVEELERVLRIFHAAHRRPYHRGETVARPRSRFDGLVGNADNRAGDIDSADAKRRRGTTIRAKIGRHPQEVARSACD